MARAKKRSIIVLILILIFCIGIIFTACEENMPDVNDDGNDMNNPPSNTEEYFLPKEEGYN